MRYFGINSAYHDGGLACFDEQGELLVFSQSERLTRKKSDPDPGDLARLLPEFGLAPVGSGDLFFSVWPPYYKYFFERQSWPDEFLRIKHSRLPHFDSLRNVHYVGHHVCHAAASWLFRDEPDPGECLYVVLDGSGYGPDGTEGFYSAGIISSTRLEEHRSTLDRDRFCSRHRLNRVELPGTTALDVAGKMMALAGYVPQEELRRVSAHRRIGPINARLRRLGLNDHLMRELACIYYSFVQDIKEHLRELFAIYPHRTVVVGGGTFLALELNTWIVEMGRKLVFCPAVNDSGIALGSAAYGYFLAHGKWPKRIASPYLQWTSTNKETNYLPPIEAARQLHAGRCIGTLIGRAEAGPRALGNRSLLAVPTRENSRAVSMEIKGREFYRPVAPIVTDRDFDKLFIGPPARFMQHRHACTPLASQLAPGIVHNDNSARAQVLRHEDNPWLYEVLVEIGKLTGVECLINTSLNIRGKPLCNSLADFRDEMKDSRIIAVSF